MCSSFRRVPNLGTYIILHVAPQPETKTHLQVVTQLPNGSPSPLKLYGLRHEAKELHNPIT